MSIIYFFIFIIILLILKVVFDITEKFIPEYLHHKSKCYDCEKDILQRYGPNAVWMAQPSKLYSAEQSGIYQKDDISGGYIGKTIKYY